MRFDWDPDKDHANRLKHGISFEDAARVFSEDSDCLEIYDEAHSHDEDRFIAIGLVEQGVVVVAFTERPDDVIRIISARMATTKERRYFEEYWRERNEERP